MKISLVNVINAQFLLIDSTICEKINNIGRDLNKEFYGGCFRSVNVFDIFIENASIIQGYSDFTTIGFKAIDTSDNNKEGKVIQNLSKI